MVYAIKNDDCSGILNTSGYDCPTFADVDYTTALVIKDCVGRCVENLVKFVFIHNVLDIVGSVTSPFDNAKLQHFVCFCKGF